VLVVEAGLLPFNEKTVTTPTGHAYVGVDFARKLCGVFIIRSGEQWLQRLHLHKSLFSVAYVCGGARVVVAQSQEQQPVVCAADCCRGPGLLPFNKKTVTTPTGHAHVGVDCFIH
jgi:uracil phosphoribosyltransferase